MEFPVVDLLSDYLFNVLDSLVEESKLVATRGLVMHYGVHACARMHLTYNA